MVIGAALIGAGLHLGLAAIARAVAKVSQEVRIKIEHPESVTVDRADLLQSVGLIVEEHASNTSNTNCMIELPSIRQGGAK
jgi:sRNA-binding carbon storage regulator CsrA